MCIVCLSRFPEAPQAVVEHGQEVAGARAQARVRARRAHPPAQGGAARARAPQADQLGPGEPPSPRPNSDNTELNTVSAATAIRIYGIQDGCSQHSNTRIPNPSAPEDSTDRSPTVFECSILPLRRRLSLRIFLCFINLL